MTYANWRPVPGHFAYEVSDRGEIRRRDTHKPIKSFPARGYRRVGLWRDGKKWMHLVHKLVLQAFIGEAPPGHQAAHGNGIRSDNRLENLRWATSLENAADKIIHGTVSKGEGHGRCRISDKNVALLRQDRAQGMLLRELSRKYDISGAQVSKIARGLYRAYPSNRG